MPDCVGGTEIYTLRLAQHLKRTGIEAAILIPYFDHTVTSEYEYEGIKVIRYAEASIEDRQMIMGKRKPSGLAAFVEVLKKERASIIHFHELAPGRGVSIFHVQQAHELNIPIVLTFHLSYYTCIKGSLIYKEAEKCDGVIRIRRCTECVYQSKHITSIKATLLSTAATTLFKTGINSTALNNSFGTALGFPYVIDKIKNDLLSLAGMVEKIVLVANWYRNILEENGVPANKMVYIKQGLTNEVKTIFNDTGSINLPLKVVFIGRICELKGVHLLIDAVCR